MAFAVKVTAPHEAGEVLRNAALRKVNGFNDLLLTPRSVEQVPKDADTRAVAEPSKDACDEFLVGERYRGHFDNRWPSHEFSVLIEAILAIDPHLV